MSWKNLKIQGKFFLGFGFIIVLLIVLSVFSIYNIQQIMSNAEMVIEGNILKSNITQKEVDHLNWQAELSNFLNNSESLELHVQKDPTLCDFGKWYYGEGRKEAELLVPQLAETLAEVEVYHRALHESAGRIEQHYSVIDAELGSFLREKMMDHINWKLNILNFLTNDDITVLSVHTDPTTCNLGLWLYSDEIDVILKNHSDFSTIYDKLLPVHQQMHEAGIQLIDYIESGEIERATKLFHSEIEMFSSETLGFIGQMIEWHDGEMDDMAKSRTIYIRDTVPALQSMRLKFSRMIEIINENIMTEDVMLSSGRAAEVSLLFISVIIAVIAVIVAFILSTAITRPIIKCVNFAEQISTGDLDVSLDINQKDQIGILCDSLRTVVGGFRDKAAIVEKFAEGDLTVEIITLSEKDGLGISLQRMKHDLNMLIGQIVTAVDQISSGSEQIAEASQNLSEGAASQASSTEEVSVMVNEISGQAAQNSDNASQARGISEKATIDAEKGNANMGEVVSIMEKINGGADETKKIVKVIDDIAFQINLLALNANVEAARAGKYGKGFAVVADEVRNLAVKSAQAAKETSQKVEESIKNIQNGSNAVEVSAVQLKEIVNGSTQVSEILAEIAAASKSQDEGISQATSGLDQIDKITQENTGNAEETAAASEELSSQSLQLKGLVQRFKLDSEGAGLATKKIEYKKSSFQKPVLKTPVYESAYGTTEMIHSTGIKPVDPSEIISLDDNDFDQF